MTETLNLRKGKSEFRALARLISVLGEQLIRDAAIGILELVKNGYDADADEVSVRLLNLKLFPEELKDENLKKDALKRVVVIVEDNGDGMTLETILSKWLTPATGHKEEAKKENKRSAKGRLPLGEKGVGRFAAQTIGHKLTLISRAKDDSGKPGHVEIVVSVNGDDFDTADAYLEDAHVEYEERQPEHLKW